MFALLTLAVLAWPQRALQGEGDIVGPSFEVRFTEDALAGPFEGRLIVYLSKHAPEPRAERNWARLEPVVAGDFAGVAAGEPMVLEGDARCFPVPLRDLEGGRYVAQAVLDVHTESPEPGTAPGNPCSAPVAVEFHAGKPARFTLVCDRTVPPVEIHETRYSRLFEVESPSLSYFHGRSVPLRALVHLPQAWFDEPERRFPVYVFLSGFGATLEGFDFVDWPAPLLEGVPMIQVYPDPSCANGHSGFADSENNGPWGEALVEELLPLIVERYRGDPDPRARLLVGHSTGGWAALWLMVHHPGAFGYAWASSPDPVDFRDFMGIDLYAEGANLFLDANGRERPFCQLGNTFAVGFLREHSRHEALVRGGVLHFFEALFSPRGADGRPAPLWDRRTGAIDPEVARFWARGDLGYYLREHWDELRPELEGRLSITVGQQDNFLLQGAVTLLRDDLAARGSGVDVRVLSGDHFSVRSSEFHREAVRAFLRTRAGGDR